MALKRYLEASLLILLLQLLSSSSSTPSYNSSCIRSVFESETQIGRATPTFTSTSRKIQNESWISYDCHVRTLNSLEFLNSTGDFILESDIARARAIRIHCNDKLFFQSFLFPNQTLFPSLSLASVAHLDIDSCKIRRLEGGTTFWNGLPFLRTLSIQSRNSQWSSSVTLELFPNSFQGLAHLQTLDLTFNNIWTLPESLLCPLKSLRSLNISQNKLAEIEELSNLKTPAKFCALPQLESVDISWNSLRQIRTITKGWGSVKSLLLANNFIDQIQDEALVHLESLTVLNLNSNRLVALPPFLFRANGRLRELYVANNSISALSPNVFSNVGELRLLDLSRNLLSSQWVKGGVFGGLKGLRVLKLSWNGLSSLEKGVFGGLGALQILSLDNNQIESLDSGVFSSLGALRALDLSNNRLSAVGGRGLEGLGALRQLYLDHNVIQEVEEGSLRNCTELTDLGLAGNLLQEVPLTLRGLTLLRSLDLGENRISQVTNSSFEGLDQLYGLRMVDNRLTELPLNFCSHLKKLRVLNVAQNRLSSISPSALVACVELRALRLDSNSLEHLPQMISTSNPSSLLWLNMSTNRISSAEYQLLPPTLEWLDLSHNLIQDFSPPRQIRPAQLRVLDISYNKIQELNFENLPPKLEIIRANHNGLKRIEIRPAQLLPLRRVELASNQLTSLPTLMSLVAAARRVPIPRKRKPDFFLGGNPFKCDCTLEWLHVPNSVIRTVDLDAIACTPTYPLNVLAPSPLSTVRDFLCPFNSHCDASCGCCDFDACDCAMICPQNCECFHDQSWTRTIVNCASNNHSQVPARIPMNTTELLLDGNSLPSLTPHIFIGRRSLRILNLNSSRVELISNKTFNGLKSLEILRLQQNLLTALQGYEFADLDNLRELYLQNNFLGFIAPHTFQPLKLLRTLRLDGNLLVSLNFQALFTSQKFLSRFHFSHNHWTCECDFITRLRSWVAARSAHLVTDFNDAQCKPLHPDDTKDKNHLIAAKCFLSSNEQHYPNKIPPPFTNLPPNLFLPFPPQPPPSPPNSRNVNGPPQISYPGPQFNHPSQTYHPNQPGPGTPNQLSTLLTGAASTITHPNNNYLPSPLDGLQFESFNQNHPGLLWTIILTSVGLLMLILVVVVIFRREIYYHLNDTPLLNLCFCRAGSASSASEENTCEFCQGVRQLSKKWWLLRSSPQQNPANSANDPEHPLPCGHHLYNNSSPSSGGAEDSEKLFDAYFLYSKKDEELVLEKIVPELERVVSSEENHMRLCLHYRDLCLSPGNPWNPEMVWSAADSSKRLVLILSRSFLNTELTWEGLEPLLHSILAQFGKKTVVILLPCLTLQIWESTRLGLFYQQQVIPQMMSNMNNNRRAKKFLRSGVVLWTDSDFWVRFKNLLPQPSTNSRGSGSVRISTLAGRSLPRNYVTAGNFNLLQPPTVTTTTSTRTANHIKHSALVLTPPPPPPPIPMHLDLPSTITQGIPTRQRQPLPNLPICSHSCISQGGMTGGGGGGGGITFNQHFYSSLAAMSDKGPVKCHDNMRPNLERNDGASTLREIIARGGGGNSLNLQCYGSDSSENQEQRRRHQFSKAPDLVPNVGPSDEANNIGDSAFPAEELLEGDSRQQQNNAMVFV